jgi:hypothetical protein
VTGGGLQKGLKLTPNSVCKSRMSVWLDVLTKKMFLFREQQCQPDEGKVAHSWHWQPRFQFKIQFFLKHLLYRKQETVSFTYPVIHIKPTDGFFP